MCVASQNICKSHRVTCSWPRSPSVCVLVFVPTSRWSESCQGYRTGCPRWGCVTGHFVGVCVCVCVCVFLFSLLTGQGQEHIHSIAKKLMSYLRVYHVSDWIWMRSLQRHKPAWYISVSGPGCDCRNILCNNSASARTGKWPFGCWALIFYFPVVQITLTGEKREKALFPQSLLAH